MHKMLIVLKHEVVTLTSRRSFWFGAIGVPLIAFLIYAGTNFINRSQGADSPSPFEGVRQIFTPEEDNRPQGYVDEANLLVHFPEEYDESQLIAFDSEAEARAALDAGEISAFYVIPANYIEEGWLEVYTPQYDLIGSEMRAQDLTRLITFNLLGGDQELVNVVRNPVVELEEINLAPENAGPRRDSDNEFSYFALPYGVMMLFYFSIMGSAGLLLNSVTNEKENRIMEVLLISTDAHSLLLGKVIGLGIVGLLQVLIWGASAITLLNVSGQNLNLPPDFQIPISLLGWGVVFFLFGYLIYATLMAGIGALVPNLREGSQATTVVIIPLLIPLFLISALIQSPNSPLAIGLSLFPLTAPTTMMLRLAATNVPVWQPLLAVALLIITSLLIVRAVAGMFRAQTLLSGQAFNVKRFFLALAGRV